ncbi:phosphatidylserine decarboxylase-domain-containing protein [Hypoxylon sp. NC1633]|nr:phosphatidylserine decarboxylase-domain-containing protein [Hypoxylon sp. NC1633]
MPSGLPTAPNDKVGFQPPLGRAPISHKPRKAPGGKSGDSDDDSDDWFQFNSIITVLKSMIDIACPGGLAKAVEAAREKIPKFMDSLNIVDDYTFLVFANDLLKWVPNENYAGKDVIGILCMFYYVFDQPPLGQFQTPIQPDQVGQPLTWLSAWIVVFAQLMGLWMDNPLSITADSYKTFVDSPKYRMFEAKVPPRGFRTFNEFFSRYLKEGARPICQPTNDKVIVYPADCAFDDQLEDGGIVQVGNAGSVSIKGLSWTIESLLQGSEYANAFDGGIWMHAFLNVFNYHRQHAPVAGRVLEAKNIQGLAYLETDVEGYPLRRMDGPGAPDTPGYQFLQCRAVVVIDNPVLGLVAVLPIGMAMVSSVKLTIRKGDVLKKGDEISTFLFGGSDIICVFQAKAGLHPENFKPSETNGYSFMGSELATAPI